MSAYTQFGYPYGTSASQLLVSGQTGSSNGAATAGAGTGPSSPGCGCETGRVVATDPVTGAAICSCQYDASPSRLSVSTHLNVNAYPRLAAPAPGSALHYSAAYAGGDPQSAYPSIGVDPAYFGSLGGAYGLKDSTAADMGVYGGIGTAAGYGYNPYDPSLYGYGAPYDLAARRKNATREATGTLKAWMNEHKKNPYPTKGEKIMLAIITKMTLTQISTWFANARRRLKKENKMTWEPKNKTDSDDEEAKTDAKQENDTDKEEDKEASNASAIETYSPGATAEVKSEALSPAGQWKDKQSPLDCEVGDPLKPKIWSLADTAVCKTPPQGVAWSGAGDGRLACSDAAGTTFPLPPTIGPGQLARFSHLTQAKSMSQSQSQSHAHQQSHSQTASMSQSAAHSAGQPTSPNAAAHYSSHHSSGGSSYRGVSGAAAASAPYGPVPTYADPGTVTPPHTPPSANKSTMSSKPPAATSASAMHGYQSTYPGVLSALERRTEAYPVQQLYRQHQHVQQMQQHVADMSQHAAARQHMTEMNHYSAAYKEGAPSSASTAADYMTQMSGH